MAVVVIDTLSVNGILSGNDAQAVIADTVSDRHVFDYLLSEVLGELPVPLRCFLLRCSVLDELTPGRCAAVSADANAAQWLDDHWSHVFPLVDDAVGVHSRVAVDEHR